MKSLRSVVESGEGWVIRVRDEVLKGMMDEE